MEIRYDRTVDEIHSLMTSPLEALLDQAEVIHKKYAASDIQQCKLLSVKTGQCPENCGYCSQSAHFDTSLDSESLLSLDSVLEKAREAKAEGATRFCMGAAWRQIPTGERFTRVLHMIAAVSELNMEVCCTLGMASKDQLKLMKDAGLTAYNHNLDTSREYYPSVVTTRTYDDRLNTLQMAREAGVQLCCGGILGLGETMRDRAAMLAELSSFNPHPESVPLNLLVPIEGTPLGQKAETVPFDEFLRMVATTRIVMPRSRVRLSAGRNLLSEEEQLQCFKAGANSIFMGDKLLTTPNVPVEKDISLFKRWEGVESLPCTD